MSTDTEQHNCVPDTPVTAEHRLRVAETFKQEHSKLLEWLLRKVSPEDAEDLLSRAFIQVLEPPHASVTQVIPYVWTTIKNLLSNHRRDRAGHRSKLILLKPERSLASPSPVAALMEEQRDDVLAKVIDRLPPGLRLTLQLRLYEERSGGEIVACFARQQGIEITERTVLRYLTEGCEICHRILMIAEKPKNVLLMLQRAAATSGGRRLAESRTGTAQRPGITLRTSSSDGQVNPSERAASVVHRRRRRRAELSGAGRKRQAAASVNSERTPIESGSGSVSVPPPATAEAVIRIELHRTSGIVIVQWPVSAASECAGLLRELLR